MYLKIKHVSKTKYLWLLSQIHSLKRLHNLIGHLSPRLRPDRFSGYQQCQRWLSLALAWFLFLTFSILQAHCGWTELHSSFPQLASLRRDEGTEMQLQGTVLLCLFPGVMQKWGEMIALETQEDRQNGIVLQTCLGEVRISWYNTEDRHDNSTDLSNTLCFTCWIVSIVRQKNTKNFCCFLGKCPSALRTLESPAHRYSYWSLCAEFE